eukprot:jgi/Ulvmu1/2452/UM136_0004.1
MSVVLSVEAAPCGWLEQVAQSRGALAESRHTRMAGSECRHAPQCGTPLFLSFYLLHPTPPVSPPVFKVWEDVVVPADGLTTGQCVALARCYNETLLSPTAVWSPAACGEVDTRHVPTGCPA